MERMHMSMKMEWRKMTRSHTLLCSLVIGLVLCGVNVVENVMGYLSFVENHSFIYMPGYSTLSIFQNWINGASMTVGEQMFFMAYPILAALPFSWSLCSEIKSGYTNQILTREKKGTYFAAKYVITFLSGSIAIVLPMAANFLANAWVLPIIVPSYQIVGGGDGIYLSSLLFSRPMIYMVLALLTSGVWAGVIACIGLTVGLFTKNAIAAILSPFVFFYMETVVTDETLAATCKYETSVMRLLHALTLNYAPAWYVWAILLSLIVVVSVLYFAKGRHDEMV